MAHRTKLMAGLGIALLAQLASEQLFELVKQASRDGFAAFRDGIPWNALAILGVAAVCARIRGGFYHRYSKAGLGRLTVWGLMALHYLGLSLFGMRRGPVSIVEFAAAALAAVSLIYLTFRFSRIGIDVFDKDAPGAVTPTLNRFAPVRGAGIEPRAGLILFLSFLAKPGVNSGMPTRRLLEDGTLERTKEWERYQAEIFEIVASIKRGSNYRLDNVNLLKPFGKLNIRMPLESMRLQIELRDLRHVVVIPSRDTPQVVEESGSEGERRMETIPYTSSHDQFVFFRKVSEELFGDPALPMPKLHVAQAVDFEQEREVAAAIREARAKLKELGAGKHYLDLTGGQAMCSVVGAVQSLGDMDRCVYISTRDYHPISYNFVADAGPEIG